MRSKIERTLLTALVAGSLSIGAWAAGTSQPVSLAQAREAASAVASDPLLGGDVHTQAWRWQREPDKPENTKTARHVKPGTPVADGLTEVIRWIVWGWVAAGVVWAGVLAWRWWLRQQAGRLGATSRATPPDWVQHLDIRPESLPQDVPAAVHTLWQCGDVRPALALLYRATLSQLVHRHQVPLQASDTEGECEQAAWHHAPAQEAAFMRQLTRVWSALSYGHHVPSEAVLTRLCHEYGVMWPSVDVSPKVAPA